jgi:hypothetical protein
MTEEELNLFKFSACLMTQTGASTTAMPHAAWETMPHVGLCRVDQSKMLECPQNAGFAAHTMLKMGHSLEALDLESFEESEQLVIRLVTFRSASADSLLPP